MRRIRKDARWRVPSSPSVVDGGTSGASTGDRSQEGSLWLNARRMRMIGRDELIDVIGELAQPHTSETRRPFTFRRQGGDFNRASDDQCRRDDRLALCFQRIHGDLAHYIPSRVKGPRIAA